MFAYSVVYRGITMLETILLIFGAVQGFMIAVILFTKKQNRMGNFYLGLFTITLASQLVMALSHDPSKKSVYLFGEVSFESFFLLGPFLYGYAREITLKRTALSPGFLLHFLPFLIFLLLRLLLSSNIDPGLSTLFKVSSASAIVFALLQLLSISIYVYMSFQVINHYHVKVHMTYNEVKGIRLNWFIWVLGVVQFFEILLIVDTKLVLMNDNTSGVILHPIVVFAIVSIISYWIAYQAYIQPNMFRLLLADEATPVQVNKEEKATELKSHLAEEEVEEFKAQLLMLMEEEKPYVDSQLTLKQFAEKLEVIPELLQSLLNEHFDQGFEAFIDQYRVEFAKQLLGDASKNHVPVTNIGFSAGFNSLKNFQKSFEKAFKVYPTEYREASQKDTP
ncbi:hypothetical protein BKI52_03185 [marine bacterium AO1-C]|nr:hypothetical protein BKI52_03185 [marine bacterium AO1-C]